MGRKHRVLVFSNLEAFGAAVLSVAERVSGLTACRTQKLDILQQTGSVADEKSWLSCDETWRSFESIYTVSVHSRAPVSIPSGCTNEHWFPIFQHPLSLILNLRPEPWIGFRESPIMKRQSHPSSAHL